MTPVYNLLYLLCFLVEHVIANTSKISIVRHQSIVYPESKQWDGLLQSKTACSSQCVRDSQCLLGHYNPVTKICALYSSNTLAQNPTEEGIILIMESRKITVDDCSETSVTGVVKITGIGPVYCENTKHGGGWTVFQRRFDGSVDFYRDWDNYKHGFGDINGEFWLGLEKLHNLTASGYYMMRVDLEDFENNTAHAIYDRFTIEDESDSMRSNDGKKFSTIDRDSTRGCAEFLKGGWWYNRCNLIKSNLNGLYLGGPYSSVFRKGMDWIDWKGSKYSLKATEMMIRRI